MICQTCKRDLPDDQFGHGRKSPHCLSCRKQATYCSGCGELHPIGAYGSHGRHAKCRRCRSVQAKRTYHADARARALQIARSMNASMPKRLRGRAFEVVDTEALVSLLLSASACAYCGGSLQQFGAALDHQVALSRGGNHTLENLVVTCKICNRAKGALSEAQFREWLEFVRKV